MSTCASCQKWLIKRETKYSAGESVVNWVAPDGQGQCLGPLKGTLTRAEFGCNEYAAGTPLIESRFKEGEPFHYWVLGPCPDCKKPECGFPTCTNPRCPGTTECLGRGIVGERVDDRCCGTGAVRYYDDGFIGENKHKLHPREKQVGKRGDRAQLTCFNCSKGIEPLWLACPFCGTKFTETKDAITGGSEL